MTVTAPVQRLQYLNGDKLGPVARFGSMLFLGVGVLLALRFGEGSPISGLIPGFAPTAMFVGALVIMLLAPRDVTLKLPVSLSVLLLITWLAISFFWSQQPDGTAFTLMRTLPLYIGTILVAGVVNPDDFKSMFVWLGRSILLTTVLAGVVYPSTRLHIDSVAFEGGTYPGWHGLFAHKNSLSPAIVLSGLAVLCFDKSTWVRYTTLAGLAALLLLSTSGTGMLGALSGLAMLIWYKLYREFDSRSNSVFVVSTTLLIVALAIATVLSMSILTNAYGKDMTFTGRTSIWSTAIEFISTRPIGGFGVSGILWQGDSVTVDTLTFWRGVGFPTPHAHNGLLDMALQIGLIGSVLYIFVQISVFLKGWQVWEFDRELSAFVVSLLVAQLFMSLSESVFLGGWLMVLFACRAMVSRVANQQGASRVAIDLRERT